MRVTLSPAVRTFGGQGQSASGDTDSQPNGAAGPQEPAFALPLTCTGDAPSPALPDDLAEAAPTPQHADDDGLDPALKAWLQPLGEIQLSGEDVPDAAAFDPFGALAAARRPGAPDLCVDRDVLAGQARASLSATPPAPAGGLHMAIEAINASVSDPYADGRAQLRFDLKFDNCDPVIITLERDQALALAHRLAEWADGGTGADAGATDAPF